MRKFINAAIISVMALAMGLWSTPVGAEGVCDSPEPDGVVWYSGGSRTFTGWLEKGGTYEGQIEACNKNTETKVIEVYSAPYSVAQNDYTGPDFITQTSWNRIADWISFPDSDSYTIASGQTVFIKFKITVPDDGTAISGSQAAAIMLEDTQVYGAEDQSNVLSTKRFSWLVFADIRGDGLRWGGQTLEWKADGPVLFDNSNGVKTYSVIENLGNVSFTAQYHVVITDAFRNGEVVFERDTEPTILPESKRANEFKWDNAPALGVFNITETINYYDNNETYTKTVYIFPLWLLIILAAMIVLLVTALILKVRKHHEKRQKT
jgi:hypothetical protein